MKVLVIDDNETIRKTLRLVLTPYLGTVVTSGDPKLLPALLSPGDIDAVLLDMNFDSFTLDGTEGLFWLERIRSHPSSPAVVVITAFGEVDLAVEAMKKGAADFVIKPWDNRVLVEKIKEAVASNRQAKAERQSVANAKVIEGQRLTALNMSLEEIKQTHIASVIKECGGNLSAAAQRLGVNRQTLYNHLKKDRSEK